MTYLRALKMALHSAIFALASLVPVSAAQAVTVNGVVPANGVEYIYFTHNGGALSIAVNGGTLNDPMIRVLVDDGSPIGALTGALVATDDDSGPGFNSLISAANAPANAYILAIGAFFLTTTEARSGVASTPDTDGTFEAIFTGNVSLSPIPLPAGLPILALGLVGLYWVARRRPT